MSYKIAHLADIHIRMITRHDEYQKVFNNLYKSLKNNKVNRIVIAGDIFHSKTQLTPEAVKITADFLFNLKQIAPVTIIVGNHDLSIVNKKRLDSITPVVTTLEKMGAACFYSLEIYTKSGLYTPKKLNTMNDDKIVFGVFGFDEEYPLLSSTDKDQEKTYIALYHGVIDKSVTDIGFQMTGKKINIFQNYDYGLFGDIHKQQYLNKKKTFAYPGSLIQQNFGEDTKKGYMIWDIETKKSKFITIKNDFAYLSYTLSKDNFSFSDMDNIDLLIDKKYKNYSLRLNIDETILATYSSIQKLYSHIRDYYKPADLVINADNKVNTLKKNTSSKKLDVDKMNLMDPNVQNILIEEFLLDKKIKKQTINKIKKLNVELNNVVLDDNFSSINWSIIEMKFNDAMKYGKGNEINFNSLKGLVGILGPNRSGKSSLIDILLYGLSNKSYRVHKGHDFVNRFSEAQKCDIELLLKCESKYYRIYRNIILNKNNNTGKITSKCLLDFKVYKGIDSPTLNKYDPQQWDDVGLSKTDNEFQIKKIFGNIDDLLLTGISCQDKSDKDFDLINCASSRRKDKIMRFLGFEVFKKLHEIAKKQSKETKVLLKKLGEIDYNTVISKKGETLKFTNESIKKEEYDKKELNDKIKLKRDELNKVKEQINTNIELINIDNINDKIKKLTNIINKLKEERSLFYDQLLSSIKLFNPNAQISNLKIEKFQEFIKLTKENIKKIELSLRENLSSYQMYIAQRDQIANDCIILKKQPWMLDNIQCIDCILAKKAFDGKNKLKEIFSNIEKFSQEIKSLETKKGNLNTKVDNAEKIENLYLKLKTIQSQIKSNSALLEIEYSNQNKYKQNKEIIKNNLLLEDKEIIIKNNLYDYDIKIKSIEKNIITNNRVAAALELEIERYKESLKEYKELHKQYDIYEHYIDMMHRDGLPYTMMINYIPKINYEVNSYLQNIVDFKFQVENDEETQSLDMYIIDGDNSKIEVRQGCGLEKFLISICLRAASIKIMVLPKMDMLIIDEGFGALHPNVLCKLQGFFETLRSSFEKIIIISHVEQLSDICNNIINLNVNDDDTLNVTM